jgi:serine/threonine-protein kinase
MLLSPGDYLDRYELLCVLSHGGMGTVWLSRMTGKLGFERLIALKTILSSYSSDRQFCDMFLDEARIAAQIDHENVARILEIGEDRGLLYYAMELIDGESLRKLYRDVCAAGEAFPMGVALRIVADACAGLHATHELCAEDGQPLEVVHRDVSPQNLLVSVRGTTKLIDFGVAKANARRSEATVAGTLKGKIKYMAPEQARGMPLDRRADVYGLGAVLYELLAGRPVRDTDDGKQLSALHDLMTGVPYLPLPEHVPEIVRVIVDCALSRDPEARFPTADALRQAIEQAIFATGVLATNDEVGNVLAHFSRERTAKRKALIERAILAAADGRLNASTILAPISSVSSKMAGMPLATASDSPPDHYITGPSMRTISATSVTANEPRISGSPVAKIAMGAIVLSVLVLVAVLGVVAGVVITRRGQASRAAAAPVTTPVPVVVGSATSEPTAPPVVVEPPPSVTTAAVASADAPITTVRGKEAGAGKRPPAKGGARTGTHPVINDEYGF